MDIKTQEGWSHERVLAEGGIYSNLCSEGHSGSCVEAGEGLGRNWKTSKVAVVLVHM